MNLDPPASVAREPAGAAEPGRYLPVSTPCAIGENTIWPMPSFSHSGSTSASMTRHSMLYCGWFETIRANPPRPDPPPQHAVRGLVRDDPVESHLTGDPQRGRDLLGPPLGHAYVEHLALPDQVVEGAEGLLERRLVVVAVRLVQIQVVGLQPPERAVRRLHDVLAGQAAVVDAGAGRPVELAEDLDRLAAHATQRPAEHLLGLGARVGVRRVEAGDAFIERRGHARAGGLLFDLGTMGDPVAVGDLADLQPAAAEVTVFHAIDPSG